MPNQHFRDISDIGPNRRNTQTRTLPKLIWERRQLLKLAAIDIEIRLSKTCRSTRLSARAGMTLLVTDNACT